MKEAWKRAGCNQRLRSRLQDNTEGISQFQPRVLPWAAIRQRPCGFDQRLRTTDVRLRQGSFRASLFSVKRRPVDSSWKCNRIVDQPGGISSSPLVRRQGRHLSEAVKCELMPHLRRSTVDGPTTHGLTTVAI